MNPNLVNGIAEALLVTPFAWPAGDDDAAALAHARAAAAAAIRFVAALPPDYTAADVYAAMAGLDGGEAPVVTKAIAGSIEVGWEPTVDVLSLLGGTLGKATLVYGDWVYDVESVEPTDDGGYRVVAVPRPDADT